MRVFFFACVFFQKLWKKKFFCLDKFYLQLYIMVKSK